MFVHNYYTNCSASCLLIASTCACQDISICALNRVRAPLTSQ
jgi:hypothetical protein